MGVRPFSNEPVVDFRVEANAQAMRAAIEKVRGELGREYDLVIGGQRSRTHRESDKIRSLNPARPSEIVGVHQKAGREHVEPAMRAALQAFESWKSVAVQERAGLVFRTAEIIRKRKPEFNAWMVLETGKNWDEAEADTCEAIDFCEFYARLALHLAEAEPAVQLPGERDVLRYIPLGVGAVISPWNFPLAIMCGMTVASVVCGSTVVLKPSSESPTVAAKFFGALEEAGLPPGVVNFCPDPARRSETDWWSTPRPASSLSRARATSDSISTRAPPASARPAFDQAHDSRDGREGLDRRGRGCRSGRRRRRCGGLGVRISGAEVLGLLAGDRG